ncbi:glycosyltransferase [Burkholderia glumae]|uniref:glycosyltransferase family 4 protein n=1 Tax=Burkholderia glumae TaxID=337 RepID=UPI000F5E08F0|nr:glycosyltransferase family 4 protein [Burkholderia glumae]MCQ0029454.1 glycosyltransferase family 4 protein [Burkholderia glumae]MCQ0035910.1 glycosyltransferase family 4 protein [Burkholderia glumae]QJW78410.1 glycosyltransferase family 4 protein [Burkholderia glumae]RQZ73712.1 glycosyltransferase [Burkholderia glumae]UVS83519.1 glycosyltransferase [Burkholderia glumae]
MKLLTLFVRYGDRDYEGAFKRLCQMYQRIGDLAYDALLIDTALPPGLHARLGPRVQLIGGDNTRREFSGWDTALAYLGPQIDQYDLVHVVTSAYENEYNGFYPYMSYGMFEFAAKNRDVALAHIDAYPAAARLLGRSFQTWGCSKFLIAAPERIRALGTFASPFPPELFFTSSRTAPFRQDAPLSRNYRQYLIDWLTGEGLPHGQWHSVFELSDANLERFRAKAMSIIDEHGLAMRLRESGARIVDFTWLHSRGLNHDGMQIPDECTQVVERNQFLFDNPIIEPDIDLTDHRGSNGFQHLFHQPGHQPFGQTRVIDALWLGNAVLRRYLDPSQPLHCAAIHLNQGIAIDDEQRAWLAQPDDTLPQEGAMPLTRGLHAVYLARDDLRDAFDLDDASGRRHLIRWWCNDGRANPRYRDFVAPSVYMAPADTVEQDMPIPLTHGLCMLCDARDDLRSQLDLTTREGRRGLVAWWIGEGRHDARYPGFMSTTIYAEAAPGIEQDASLPITRGLLTLHVARDDLNGIDLSTRSGREQLISWWMIDGRGNRAFSNFMADAVYVQPSDDVEQDTPLPITRGLLALARARADLAGFDLTTVPGRNRLIAWWIQDGRKKREIASLIPANCFDEVDPSVTQDAILPITRGMHALYRSRDDLMQSMDLATAAGRRAYVGWWVLHALHDPSLSGSLDRELCAQTAPGIVQDTHLPITRGLAALHSARADLAALGSLETREGRAALIEWWLGFGMHDSRLASLVSAHTYAEIEPSIEQDAPMPINRLMCHLGTRGSDIDVSQPAGRRALALWWARAVVGGRLTLPFDLTREMLGLGDDADAAAWHEVHPVARAMYEVRDDLQAAFDIKAPEAQAGLNRWLLAYGRFELGLSAAKPASRIASCQPVPWEGAWRQGGVNIIGFGRGELGIGEDVRMASRALAEVDCDQCVPHLPLPICARQADRTLEYLEVDKPLYRTNLIFLPHYETIRLLGATRNTILGGRYNIGCWQWELPRYPAGMEAALDVVDEIWSSTTFTADAMRGATDKPVHVMPMAVALPPLTRPYAREMFGVPRDAFAFLHILDGNSSVYRKNPLAVVRAFLQAFPRHVTGVHLVLKTMNMGASSAQWDEVLRLVHEDPRVTIISGAFERERVVGLQSVCDCFVSLHRAEGFGRNIAEAMLLGKPVIASNFSGNRDFTTDATAFMVEGELVPVADGEYSFGAGQHWWDADIEAAANCMLRCVEDVAERERRAANGKAQIIEHYAPAAVGRNYAERLRMLGVLE